MMMGNSAKLSGLFLKLVAWVIALTTWGRFSPYPQRLIKTIDRIQQQNRYRYSSLGLLNFLVNVPNAVEGFFGMKKQETDNENENAAIFETSDSGLSYRVIKEGHGPIPKPGQMVKVHYTGWLKDFYKNKFDCSRDFDKPFRFKLGSSAVIRGWNECISTMKVGEQRELIVPPDLAFGKDGTTGRIGPGATLYFELELLAVE